MSYIKASGFSSPGGQIEMDNFGFFVLRSYSMKKLIKSSTSLNVKTFSRLLPKLDMLISVLM